MVLGGLVVGTGPVVVEGPVELVSLLQPAISNAPAIMSATKRVENLEVGVVVTPIFVPQAETTGNAKRMG